MGLLICPGCHRHVKDAEARCPFCGGDIASLPGARAAGGAAMLLGVGAVLVACSSTSTSVYAPVPHDTGRDVAVDSGSAVDTGADTFTAAAYGPPPGSCAAPTCDLCPDSTSCLDCVSTADQPGLIAANGLFVQACACTTGSTCFADCGSDPNACPTLSTTASPSQACIACLNGKVTSADSCRTAFETACAANVDCARFLQGMQSCPP